MEIESKSVLRITDPVSRLGQSNIELLKDFASKAELRRSRICFHVDDSTLLQEMHICLSCDSYIRPAKHHKKVESLTVVDGLAKLILFQDTGHVDEVIDLGPYSSGRSHYYRLNYPVFHTLVVETKTFLFHEVTEGPFDLLDTESAKWSPDASNISETLKFMKFLRSVKINEKFNG